MSRLKEHHEQALTPAGSETVKLIRQTRQATQKRYTAEAKIRIVMEGIRGEELISAICRREGLHSNLYYRWLKDFMEAGKARLKGEETRGATRGETEELERENARLKELVANLSVEGLVLKRSLL